MQGAGIDPATLNNYDAYKAAFEKLTGMKSQLGINSVVSMAAGPEMGWVTAHHNFNSLLAAGLPYGDMSVVNNLLAGKVDMTRLEEYADWVELLFTYADKAVLLTGNYDAQVNAFATGKAVFLHQGNWTDPNIKAANTNFKMGFAPHGSMHKVTDGIFVSAPSYYVINAESKNVEGAKKYLNDLVYSQQGQDFVVNKAGMIPAFKNNLLKPAGPLSRSVQKWASYHCSGVMLVLSWHTWDLRLSFSIFLFHGFIKGIPAEVEEASTIDGCSQIRTYWMIVTPLLKPIHATVFILNGIWIWNDFLLPLLVLGKGNAVQTLPLAIANYAGAYVKQWDLILTAILISVIPVILFFLIAQRFIIKGVVAGSIK
jgi:hypothetical protein